MRSPKQTILRTLHEARAERQREIEQINQALRHLGLKLRKSEVRKLLPNRRRMSAAARRKISDAQRARWAIFRKTQQKKAA
jgi:uncharacterized coiled-coil protein SlyX